MNGFNSDLNKTTFMTYLIIEGFISGPIAYLMSHRNMMNLCPLKYICPSFLIHSNDFISETTGVNLAEMFFFV